MGRRANTIPSRPLHVMLASYDLERVDQLLWSEFENRVPVGAYQKFFTTLIRQHLGQEELDLAPFTGSLPGEFVIRGETATIQHLKSILARLP